MKAYNIDISSLKIAIRQSRNNSLDFLQESELLFALKSYGHSLSFAILGIEEFGKSIAYGLILRNKLIPIKGRIEFDPDELLKDIQSRHFSKQSISLVFSLLYQLSLKEMNELKRRLDKQSKTISYSKEKKKFENLSELTHDFKTVKKLRKEIDRLDLIDRQKQHGLYVEVSNSNEINVPRKTSSKVVKSAIGTLKRLLKLDVI